MPPPPTSLKRQVVVMPAHFECLEVCAVKENASNDGDVRARATAPRQKRSTEFPSSCFVMVTAIKLCNL